MVTKMHDITGLRSLYRLFAGALVLAVLVQPVAATEQDEIQEELKFASGLVQMRFPDYAQRAVDKLLVKYPIAKAQSNKVRVEVLTSRGKFDEAEALLKAMPPGSPETMVVQLSLGDQYYAWGKMADAKRTYESFFSQFPKGPPAEIARLYGESAYKFSQMLMLSGDLTGALDAYRRVMTCPLNSKDIERRVQTEMAELCVRVADLPIMTTNAPARKKVLEEAAALCNKVQYGGTDLWFAKTVVILAHIKMANKDRAGARKTILDYTPMLTDVDSMLKEAGENMKLSPMAECKFLLGSLFEEDGRAFAGNKDKLKLKEGSDLLLKSLSQYWTVAQKYPGSSWAPESRRRGDAVVDVLWRDFGIKVKQPAKQNADQLVSEQVKEARLLFQNNDFKTAAERYVDILNISDQFTNAPWAVSELARCYIELKDEPYARAMTEFLAERYCQTTNQYEAGGNALLAVASSYDDRQAWMKSDVVYSQYYACYPSHSKAPVILFRQGENALRVTNTVAALKNFKAVADSYPNARIYPDALSRMAYCLFTLGDYTNAIPALTNYLAQLSVGTEQLHARLRLADAYRASGMVIPALNEYARLLKIVKDEAAKFSAGTPEDVARMKKIEEIALYSKAACYSRLKEPAAQLPLYQSKAIEGYETFLKEYPKSELAPTALGAAGVLYSLLNKPKEAGAMFDRLTKEYPGSPQAQNMVAVSAGVYLEMGMTNQAVMAYADMMKTPALYKPSQFLQGGGVLLDVKRYDVARQLFTEAQKTKDVPFWQAATLGIGQSLSGMGDNAEAVKVLEDFLTKFPRSSYMVSVNLCLSRAYAEVAKKEPDAQKSKQLFDKAYRAMSKVRQYAKDDLDMMARADVEMAAIQVLMGDKLGALASYQRILLFFDPSNMKARPHVEQAFERSLALFRETGRYTDMLEACETYLKHFPQGLFVTKARAGRDEAKSKLASGSN